MAKGSYIFQDLFSDNLIKSLNTLLSVPKYGDKLLLIVIKLSAFRGKRGPLLIPESAAKCEHPSLMITFGMNRLK